MPVRPAYTGDEQSMAVIEPNTNDNLASVAGAARRSTAIASRARVEKWSGIIVLTAIALIVATGSPGQVGADIQRSVWLAFRFLFLSPLSIVILATIFALEWKFPARAEQRGLSPLVVMDSLYLIVTRPVAIVLVAATALPARDFVEANVASLSLEGVIQLPTLATLVIGVALGDAALWISHVIRHKVPFLWRFHMVHHSQERLSVFSASRDHPLDSLFESFIMLVPLIVLFPDVVADAQALTLYAVGVTWFIRFTHSNIATNLGPLRWILVTPQSHRIHHSRLPEHWNSNYANIFAWDRLFGFQHPDDTSFPETGVNNPDFPSPKSYAPTEIARCFAGQLIFPFDTAAVKVATRAPESAAEESHASDE